MCHLSRALGAAIHFCYGAAVSAIYAFETSLYYILPCLWSNVYLFFFLCIDWTCRLQNLGLVKNLIPCKCSKTTLCNKSNLNKLLPFPQLSSPHPEWGYVLQSACSCSLLFGSYITHYFLQFLQASWSGTVFF